MTRRAAITCPRDPIGLGYEEARKYLFRDTDRHGNLRIYVRIKGRKVRIRAPVGSEEFNEAYRAAIAAVGNREVIRPASKLSGGVYFILNGPDRVKIGFSKAVRKRRSDLQIGSPTAHKIYYVTPGDRQLENDLHRLFNQFRINGEWFLFAPAIRKWIAEDETRRMTEMRSSL